MDDKQRLDWLDSLTQRTEFQNKRVPARPVSSDMHFTGQDVTLYLRDLYGNAIVVGYGGNVREAIDDAMTKAQAAG